MKKFVVFAILAALSSAGVAHADEEGVINNRGLIEQTVSIQGAITMVQQQSVGSTQAVNMIDAQRAIANDGAIRQSVNASSLNMTQNLGGGNIQAGNLIRAGNSTIAGQLGFGR